MSEHLSVGFVSTTLTRFAFFSLSFSPLSSLSSLLLFLPPPRLAVTALSVSTRAQEPATLLWQVSSRLHQAHCTCYVQELHGQVTRETVWTKRLRGWGPRRPRVLLDRSAPETQASESTATQGIRTRQRPSSVLWLGVSGFAAHGWLVSSCLAGVWMRRTPYFCCDETEPKFKLLGCTDTQCISSCT